MRQHLTWFTIYFWEVRRDLLVTMVSSNNATAVDLIYDLLLRSAKRFVAVIVWCSLTPDSSILLAVQLFIVAKIILAAQSLAVVHNVDSE